MSWEENDYTSAISLPKAEATAAKASKKLATRIAAEKTEAAAAKAASPSPSRSRSRSRGSEANNDPDYVEINLEGKGITDWEEIEKHPGYAKAIILKLRGNKLKSVDGYYLPDNLMVLDLRENEITEIKQPEKFPLTLKVLWLDDNQLTKLPTFAAGMKIDDYTFEGNPLKPTTDFVEKETVASSIRSIRWYTSEWYANNKFTDEERSELQVRSGAGDFFAELKHLVLKNVQPDVICRAKIADSYIEKQIRDCEHLVIEVHKAKIVAFAMIDMKTDQLHIPLICSTPSNKGGGGRIMDVITTYFKGHPEFTRITLDAISDAHGFYLKKGFRSCITGQLCPMEYVRGAGPAPRNENLRNILGAVSGGGRSRRRKLGRKGRRTIRRSRG
jgi:hypothetical protein